MKKENLDDYLKKIKSLSSYIDVLSNNNYNMSPSWIIKEVFDISDSDIEMSKKMKISRERFGLLDGK